jgi:MFS family permease
MFKRNLWRDGEFLKLWWGQFISETGSQVSTLALPTVAIFALNATPFEVGLLRAFGFLAFPVLGLVAGVWVDRLRRRPVLIVCDIIRLIALGSVPAAFLLHLLSIGQLYAVALVVGVGTVFFAVAYQSYLPALIDRSDLVEGNSKLQVTVSVAQMAGPALAGLLIQLVGAARAVSVDAASFVVSVLSLLWIHKAEPVPRPTSATGRSSFSTEMLEGIRFVFGNATISRIAGASATSNLGGNIFFAVYLIYAYRVLHLSPGVMGVILGAGAVGGLVGALIASLVADRLGLGPALFLSVMLAPLSMILVPVAQLGFAIPLLFASQFIVSFLLPVYNINQVSLRQAITPDHIQGRMNATVRTIIWGTIPIGAFIGGLVGGDFGLLTAIYLGVGITALSGLWILAGPIRLKLGPELVTLQPVRPTGRGDRNQ